MEGLWVGRLQQTLGNTETTDGLQTGGESMGERSAEIAEVRVSEGMMGGSWAVEETSCLSMEGDS